MVVTRADQYRDFLTMFTRLLLSAMDKGIPLRFGEAYRTPRQAQLNAENGAGIANSKHCYSLAVDLWIYNDDGKGIDWKSDLYRELGEEWEKLGGKWGGRFTIGDLCHFEYENQPL
jgi:hypothetical protein